MFERPHHQRIAAILGALDAELLASHACYFGGGTAIALRYGEFRESVDIDFLVADLPGYRALRQLTDGPDGLGPLFRPDAGLRQHREVRADQYGIRSLVDTDGRPVKFEIVLEGRIAFERPSPQDRICGVTCLAPVDMAASKLLANADRWGDTAVMRRDIIDLAMMNPSRSLLRQALVKTRQAYGDSIDSALRKAVDYLRTHPQQLDACMRAMAMTTVPRATLWQRIKALETVLPPPPRD